MAGQARKEQELTLLSDRKMTTAKTPNLREVNLGFGFDDEEGVGVGSAGGVELGAGFVERVGEDGEDDAPICAANEIEAALLLDEFEWAVHGSDARCVATRSIHGSR